LHHQFGDADHVADVDAVSNFYDYADDFQHGNQHGHSRQYQHFHANQYSDVYDDVHSHSDGVLYFNADEDEHAHQYVDGDQYRK
jgi:hypothetical protein